MRIGTAVPTAFYEEANKMGYDYVEFPGLEISKLSQEEFQDLVERVKALGLPVLGFNAYCGNDVAIVGDNFSSEKIQAYAELMCQRGSELGIKSIGIGAPAARMIPADYSKTKADEQAVEFVRITAGVAKEYGINVLFEAVHDKMCDYCNYTSHCKEIVDTVNMDNVQMVLDFYHVEVMGENLLDSIKVEGITHLHINHLGENYDRGYITNIDRATLINIKNALKEVSEKETITIEANAAYFLENGQEGLDVMKEVFCEGERN